MLLILFWIGIEFRAMTETDKRVLGCIDAAIRAKNPKFKVLWGNIVIALEKGRGSL